MMILRCVYCDTWWEFDIKSSRVKRCFTCQECKQDVFFRTDKQGDIIYSDFGKKCITKKDIFKRLKQQKNNVSRETI